MRSWPTTIGRTTGLWLNTNSDLKVLAMMLRRPVHLIQQYSNGDALVTVYTTKCEPPCTQKYKLSDTSSF